ncbi:lipopolysaccharide export system protein LptC [Rhodoferax sp. OV413]|uniref:LPS export ABC transporter periplasmic protein LptC n=1 Tax=Rhodoferax sp. OV413 TaxID=1855285 RepID=UPI0008907295|nr:LPS export ABC transporter periplasmic protein LptC [Rhodoferax sp. OV413]SDO71174.1 lipopolysaccharide export system protein LptC [Rhodoferax sp. OV413]
MKTVLRSAWERLSIYLPIILMAVLALCSYWLVRNTPIFTAAGVAAPVSHEPDYFMRTFSVKTFDALGRLKSEVLGVEARHFPDNDTVEIDKVRIRSVNPEGLVTVATADRGLSNADGSEVQLFGNAVVVREAVTSKGVVLQPRLEFRSDFLHAYMETERVRSNKPVTLIRGKDTFTADTMDYDNLDRQMQLNGRVRGILQPQAAP